MAIATLRAAGLLALMTLGACTAAQHPVDRYLSGLRPVTVAPLEGKHWPAGTMLCPLTPYQSSLPASAPAADRVNAYLARKHFLGDENHWSLVVVNAAPAGDDGIEQLVFKRGSYDIVTEPERLVRPAGFTLQACVPAGQARVLVTRGQSGGRTLIAFGT